MKKLALFGILVAFIYSCEKKAVCEANMSDEVWLIVKDTNGTNLIDSLYTDTPSIYGSVRYHPEIVTVNDGTENLTSWKIDLDKIGNGGPYQLSNQPIPGDLVDSGPGGEDFFYEIEFEIEPKKIKGCRKKHIKASLVWMRINEVTFYGPGVHTYIEN